MLKMVMLDIAALQLAVRRQALSVCPRRVAHPAGGRLLVQRKEIHHGGSTLSVLQRPL
jgi:hypothetical protein